jgi:hypothetical protein
MRNLKIRSLAMKKPKSKLAIYSFSKCLSLLARTLVVLVGNCVCKGIRIKHFNAMRSVDLSMPVNMQPCRTASCSSGISRSQNFTQKKKKTSRNLLMVDINGLQYLREQFGIIAVQYYQM